MREEQAYRAVSYVFRAWVRAQDVRMYAHGLDNVPRAGAIVASNHVSYLDFAFVDLPLLWERDLMVRFVARREVFDHWLAGPVMRAMGQIEIDPYGGDTAAAFANALRVLAAGGLVGMHPEGTISPSFVPLTGKTGTVRLAAEAAVPIVPTAVWGGQRIVTKWRPRNLQRHIPVLIRYGEPYHPTEEDPKAATADLMERINDLLVTAQALYPDEPAGSGDRWWLPAHLGGTAPTPEEALRRVEEQHAERRALRRR